MPKRTKVSWKNLPVVFGNIIKMCGKDIGLAKQFCVVFDEFLDELCSGDFFGTEAQCDPRGDQRD
jgi:hypothetical protein